jgi:hypothetical protein
MTNTTITSPPPLPSFPDAATATRKKYRRVTKPTNITTECHLLDLQRANFHGTTAREVTHTKGGTTTVTIWRPISELDPLTPTTQQRNKSIGTAYRPHIRGGEVAKAQRVSSRYA